MLQHNNAPPYSFPSKYSQLSCKIHHTCPPTSVFNTSRTNRILLVPKDEIHTERSNIESVDAIQENSQKKLCAFPKKKTFQQCSKKQKELWEQCIRSARNYSEKDKAK